MSATVAWTFFGTPDLSPIVPSGDMDRPFGWFLKKGPSGRGGHGISRPVRSQRFSGDQLLLTLEQGHDVLAPSCDLGALVEVGSEVLAYLDEHRRLLGWYLPQSQIGVDLREWKGDT